MNIKIPCPQCRGHAIGETAPEKPFKYFRENLCSYCLGKGTVSLVKHYFNIGEGKKIRNIKRYMAKISNTRWESEKKSDIKKNIE